MNISNEELTSLTIDVCQTMLGLEVLERVPGVAVAEPELTSTISITGEYEASVEVSLCQTAGQALTSAMFAIEAEDTQLDEIADAISELVNIIGGNVKGLLDAECTLSIPTFSQQPSEDRDGNSQEVLFDLDGGVMKVSFRTVEPANK